MPRIHVVQQGESLSAIAHRYGFFDARTVYDDPSNAGLRDKRPDPDLLYPGDEVVIPDREARTETGATDRRHRFSVRGKRSVLRIFLRDILDEPLAGVPYDLEIDGQKVVEGRPTGADGLVEHPIAPDARRGTLTTPEWTWTFAIGALNPIPQTPDDGISGVQGRLWNLGYDTGPIDGVLGKRTAAALRHFQEDQHLPVTGRADPATVARLVQVHGC